VRHGPDHAETSSAASTDWRQITLLYDRLIRIQPTPVVELNRAVALAMYEGPEQGLCLIDDLLTREKLANYSLAYSARADLCRRPGRLPEARASYEKAVALARQKPERRFLSWAARGIEMKNWLCCRFPLRPTTIG
jgi:RNA polymerase sigma-70 factor, ECF subfamily